MADPEAFGVPTAPGAVSSESAGVESDTPIAQLHRITDSVPMQRPARSCLECQQPLKGRELKVHLERCALARKTRLQKLRRERRRSARGLWDRS